MKIISVFVVVVEHFIFVVCVIYIYIYLLLLTKVIITTSSCTSHVFFVVCVAVGWCVYSSIECKPSESLKPFQFFFFPQPFFF